MAAGGGAAAGVAAVAAALATTALEHRCFVRVNAYFDGVENVILLDFCVSDPCSYTYRKKNFF